MNMLLSRCLLEKNIVMFISLFCLGHFNKKTHGKINHNYQTFKGMNLYNLYLQLIITWSKYDLNICFNYHRYKFINTRKEQNNYLCYKLL